MSSESFAQRERAQGPHIHERAHQSLQPTSPSRCHQRATEQKESIKAIDHFQDIKVRAKGDDGSIVLWELFSRRLSARAGKVVGYGRGRVSSQRCSCFEMSCDTHNLRAISLPVPSALPRAISLSRPPISQHPMAAALRGFGGFPLRRLL